MTRKLTIKSTSAVHSELYDFVCSKSSYQEVTDRTSDEEVSNEIQSGNTTTVLAMSEQERESALQEIQSFLSPKSIEFLQRRTSGSLPKSTEFNEVCDKVQSSGQNSSQEFADAPSSEWLQQQMQATEKRPALDQHIPATMHSERFDLNGRRIVDFEGETILEEKYISASGLFTVQLESSPDLVRSIAAIICSVVREAVIPMSDVAHGNPFYVPQDVAMASAQHQPQDELKHHQYEQGASGYNMLEISEVYNTCTVYVLFVCLLTCRCVAFCLHFTWVSLIVNMHACVTNTDVPLRVRSSATVGDAHAQRHPPAQRLRRSSGGLQPGRPGWCLFS